MQPGQKVLVIGAAGGVGSFAVQLAKAFGAEVTGVCSTTRVGLVRSIGADHVIDDTREDFGDGLRHWDLRAPILSRLVSQTPRPLSSKERSEDLVVLKDLIEAGRVTPVIDRDLPAERGPPGHPHLEAGHARGKIVITV